MDQENKNQTLQNIYSQTTTPVVVETSARMPKDKRRHFLATFFLSFLWGSFGVDRFYLGKIFTGVLKLLTFGGFGIWTIVDLALIMSGAMRDKEGRELIDASRYKKFARNTIVIFTLSCGVMVLISGIGLINVTSQFLQNNSVEQYLNGSLTGGNSVQGLLNGQIDSSSINQLVGF